MFTATVITMVVLQAGNTSGIGGIMIILIIIGLAIYFIPAIAGRNKRSAGAILLLNLFLGWTFIGWVGALIWACSADAQPPVIVHNATSLTSKVEQLERLVAMYKNGALTDEEYEAEKRKLLA